MSKSDPKDVSRSFRLPAELDRKLSARCAHIAMSEFVRYAVALALSEKNTGPSLHSEFRVFAARILALLGPTGISETVSRLREADRNGAPALAPEEHEALIVLSQDISIIKALLLEMLRAKDPGE